MNKQQTKTSRGIEWTHVFGPGTGYTWNPVRGCLHSCRWTMPDGTTAQCYAETVAEGVAQAAYPEGFDHHYWNPGVLSEPLRHKQPAGIFLDSMSDLMGHWVPDEEIAQVLDVCSQTPQRIYFLLTKNARRLTKFEFPPNVWVGASLPPSEMMGKPLRKDQQFRMLMTTLNALSRVKVMVRWMSFEPLSWNVSLDIADFGIALGEPILNWAVIGAATNGRKVYQPEPHWVDELTAILHEQGARVFFKGNLKGNEGAEFWLEEFPIVEATHGR